MFLCLYLLTGCHPCDQIEPSIFYSIPERCLEQFPSSFPPLTAEEREQDWGKELTIGNIFAREGDFYRAITSFKRALILLPENYPERTLQIEFCILQSYYLGNKYAEVIDIYEHGHLGEVALDFPALKELLIMLEDSYMQLERPKQAAQIQNYLQSQFPEIQEKLNESRAIIEGDIPQIQQLAHKSSSLTDFIITYQLNAKSPQKAQMLNALLPGAGYYYAGQHKAALTSFIINALFIAAAYEFFDRGYYAAGAITASLEAGWYFGGINGAGLAIKEYNERLYDGYARDFLIQQKLFPVLMFNYVF